jgi:nucleoside-diphosphate kinase
MERTLILLKPDCLARGNTGAVIARFEQAGFRICGAKMLRLTDTVLAEHYSHLVKKPFYPEIVDFMKSTPVIGLILEGDKAVARVRELLGPTDSKKAAKGTIRGDFGQESMRNVCHASDSVANAEAEIKRFFRPEEVFGW